MSQDLHQRAFRFLQQLAQDLSAGEVVFPTFIDATVKVRLALNNPGMDADRLAQIVSAEPLLSLKLVRLANSAALNPGGRRIADVKSAVLRVGFAAVRTTAVAVAMEQLLASKELERSFDTAKLVWEHSVDVAARAYVIARAMTRINPDEALFAGMVHDVGHFYLLSRSNRYPELAQNAEEFEFVLREWHGEIGHAVLNSLGLSEEMAGAVARHDQPVVALPPTDLAGVLSLANAATRCPNPLERPTADSGLWLDAAESSLVELMARSEPEIQSLIGALTG
jgi:HD-like signal output (HDOD) protein